VQQQTLMLSVGRQVRPHRTAVGNREAGLEVFFAAAFSPWRSGRCPIVEILRLIARAELDRRSQGVNDFRILLV